MNFIPLAARLSISAGNHYVVIMYKGKGNTEYGCGQDTPPINILGVMIVGCP